MSLDVGDDLHAQPLSQASNSFGSQVFLLRCQVQLPSEGKKGLPLTWGVVDDSGVAGHVGAAAAHLGRVADDGATGGSGDAAPTFAEVEDSRCGSYSVQIWFSATDTPSFDDTFFPVVCFHVGFTHRPLAWQRHVAISAHPLAPHTGHGCGPPSTGHGRGSACTAMACSTWKTLKVELGDLQVLMMVRTLLCGSMHASVDPFYDHVRPNIPLGRWLSEIRVGSDLGQLWLRFCSASFHDLAPVWAHRRFLRT